MHAPKAPFDKPDTPAPNQASGEGSSSATGIFGTVSPPPTRTEEDLLASLAREQQTPAAPNPPSVQQAAPAASSSPGEFTRMLQALTTPAQTAPSSPPAANPSEELARVFSHVSIEKKPTAEPVKPASPGSFTQMFSTMSAASATEPAAPSAAPPAAQPPAASPASGPGEFTKMFQGMQGQSGVSEQGSFPPLSKPSRSAEPGAFTQMFSTHNPAVAPQGDPLKSLPPEPAPEADLKFWKDHPQPAEPGLPAQGGFTQLLQALSQEPAVKAPEAPVYAPPAAAPPAPAVGGFTQLLRTLSSEPPAPPAAVPPLAPPPAPVAAPPMAPSPIVAPPVAPPMMPLSPVAPTVSSGPGEFTRVISGSALRDLQSQSGAPSAPPPTAPVAQPAWPPAPIPPPPAMHLPQPAPPIAPQAFAFPPTPAPPPPAAPAPATGALQKYMPLILVLNIFLMLAIVLILIFVFHHK